MAVVQNDHFLQTTTLGTWSQCYTQQDNINQGVSEGWRRRESLGHCYSLKPEYLFERMENCLACTSLMSIHFWVENHHSTTMINENLRNRPINQFDSQTLISMAIRLASCGSGGWNLDSQKKLDSLCEESSVNLFYIAWLKFNRKKKTSMKLEISTLAGLRLM